MRTHACLRAGRLRSGREQPSRDAVRKPPVSMSITLETRSVCACTQLNQMLRLLAAVAAGAGLGAHDFRSITTCALAATLGTALLDPS